MPAPRSTKNTRNQRPIMPVASAPEDEAFEGRSPLLTRPLYTTPRPTFWQRLWYGASAEAKIMKGEIAANQTSENPLDEVKAGVLNEMRNIANTKGGVSGSPFSSVVLPQGARANANPSPVRLTATPQKQPQRKGGWGWFWLFVGALALIWFALNRLESLRNPPLPPLANLGTTELLPPPAELKPAPKPIIKPVAKPEPKTVAKTVDILAPKPHLLGVAQLAKALQSGTAKTTPVGNQKGSILFTPGFTNTSGKTLQNIALQLNVADMAGKPLLTRVLQVVGPVANGQSVPAQVLKLDTASAERHIGQVPLKALRVKVTPLRAESVE